MDLFGGALDIASGFLGLGGDDGSGMMPGTQINKQTVVQTQNVSNVIGGGGMDMASMLPAIAIGGVAILAIVLLARK